MALGSPIAPALAELVMDDVTKYVLTNINFDNLFLVRYVDDFFCVLPEEKIDHTLDNFNSYHNRLVFTIEKEKNSSITFLDKIIYRKELHLYTNWYSKDWSSHRVLNFFSNCRMQYKINTLNNMIFRILTLSSDRFHKENY